MLCVFYFFFFSSRRRHTRCSRDWSSDVCSSDLTSGTQVKIEGTLNSAANHTFTVEFFANSGTDSNGNVEGERLLGSATVSTDNTGNAAFSSLLSGSVSVGESVTATATDNATGDTSEFSQAVGAQAAVPQNFVVTTLADENDPAATVASPGGGGLSLREALALAAGNPGPDSIAFAANLTGGSTPGVDDGHLVLTHGELVIN